jgi:hypothetical protein
VGYNNLTTLNITNAGNLTTLVIENSKLTNFSQQNLPNLTSLSINDTASLNDFSDNTFPNLISLTLINVNLTYVDLILIDSIPILEQLIIRDSVHYAELFNVTINSLQLLQIINNPNFTVFYQNQFNNLTVLDLRNNNISQFCDENLSSLVSLNL